jgi:hypothetical protein
MTDLEQRVAALEALVKGMCRAEEAGGTCSTMDDAMLRAIYTVVEELAEKAGVSRESFLEHFDLRFRWWHDYYLRQTEDVSPGLAAQRDHRTLADADIPPTYPPLFSAPPNQDT